MILKLVNKNPNMKKAWVAVIRTNLDAVMAGRDKFLHANVLETYTVFVGNKELADVVPDANGTYQFLLDAEQTVCAIRVDCAKPEVHKWVPVNNRIHFASYRKEPTPAGRTKLYDVI